MHVDLNAHKHVLLASSSENSTASSSELPCTVEGSYIFFFLRQFSR